jgi:Uma2 family endonuclease
MIAELVGGELWLQPRPAKPQAVGSSALGGLLNTRFQLGIGGPGGWWIVDEPELHLGGDVLVPDLAGWRREVLRRIDTRLAYFTEAPQWVAEVLSPSTARRDRLIKLEIYLRAGVRWAWLVDPEARSLEVFRASEAGWVRVQTALGPDTVALEPFEAVPTELELVWLPDELEAPSTSGASSSGPDSSRARGAPR